MLSASFASWVGVMLSLSKAARGRRLESLPSCLGRRLKVAWRGESMWEPISFQRQSREATALTQPHAASSRCAVPE